MLYNRILNNAKALVLLPLLLAATGAGVAVLPELFARRHAMHRSEVVVRPLDAVNADRDVALLARRSDRSGDGLALMADTLRRASQQMGLSD